MDDQGNNSTLDPVVREAQDRFRRCLDWEANARKLFLDDLKICEADTYNGYQWPNEIRRNRDVDERPCLTVNKIRQHNLQIINDAKQNKPEIKIIGTGNGATFEAAQALMSVTRRIERISNATTAYDTATSFQVRGGIGYFLVETDWASDDSFDQEIFIRRVDDPMSIFLDPDAKEADKSDSKFGFIFKDYNREEFAKANPQWKEYISDSPLGSGSADNSWISDKTVRVARYYRKRFVKDSLIAMDDGQGGQQMVMGSELEGKGPDGKALRDAALADPKNRTRELKRPVIEHFLIIGERVVKKTVWPGKKYIPIVPVIGEETVIEGVMDRKGHTRAMIDPQRIYNYWTSSAVEQVALQGKTPWKAPAISIEGFEEYWNTANRINHAVLPWNAFDDQGNAIPEPKREQPPVMAQAYIQGMQIAQNELMLVSGQYQAQMGAPSNERSGVAISERQRQGDTATYHYIDNLAVAIRHAGRIILELIPVIYDTKRVLQCMAEDGTYFDLMIDPGLQQSFAQHQNWNGQVAMRALNPKLGEYWVDVDTGPGYATKRQEAAKALTQIITEAPALTQIVGDLLLQSADFELADEAAARLRRMVPPQALGQGPTQNEQQLMMQLQQAQGALKALMDEVAEGKLKLKGKDAARDIDAYRAETERGKVFLDHGLDIKALALQVMQLMKDMQQTDIDVTANASEAGLQQQAGGGAAGGGGAQAPSGAAPANGEAPPVQGARKAPDGQWYLDDPHRPGKYLRVAEAPQ